MRNKSSYMIIGLVLLAISLLTSCNSHDEYYARPEWLEPPIYTQLKDSGIFTSYLKCVEIAGYKKTLEGAGYFTVFAPTNDAFSAYLAKNGISSIDAIDSVLAKKIVTYSMCVTPASLDQINDYQDGSTTATVESTKDKAFKRTTYNYKWVYQEMDPVVGDEKYVIDINTVNGVVGSTRSNFLINDFNQKNIPIFTSDYMAQRGISAADYNYFYPNTVLTAFNVADATVVTKDLWAENGIIHVVDKVIPPLNNLEEILAKNDECSEFRRILNNYIVQYSRADENFQLKYEQASGQRQDVYLKTYPGCCFAPNCENYLKSTELALDMDAQTNGFTLFAPTNNAMDDFYKKKFFKYGYTSIDEMPDNVILEFVNAHMFMKTVWPTKFGSTTNLYGEPARFDAYSDVVNKEIGSNGFFYAVNKVQATNSFYTVLGDVLLNPQYSLMYQALLDVEPLAENLKSKNANYLLFLITNDQFAAAGLAYNPNSSAWEFTSDINRPDLGTSAKTALTRMLNMHIVLLGTDEAYDLMNGTGVVKTYGDEYVGYSKGKIFGPGNPTAGRPKINSAVDSGAENGTSYTLSTAILFSNGNIGEVLSVTSTNKAYKSTQLLAYLKKIANATYSNEGVQTYVSSCVYTDATGVIKDIANTSYITVFLPNDVAIAKAVTDGVLKPIGEFANGALGPDVLSNDNTELDNFMKYHIIKGNIVVGDVLSTELSSYRKLEDGTYARLKIDGDDANGGTLRITDNQGRTANVVTSATAAYNILGNRAIVHVIDNYLAY